jgi:hypothetical protein
VAFRDVQEFQQVGVAEDFLGLGVQFSQRC